MEQKKDDLEIVRPIIIKRIKKSGHAFHGGSWKVAFADFATAMMAFFLLLWLMGNTTDAEKQAISGYFNDPAGVANKSGATTAVIGEGGKDIGNGGDEILLWSGHFDRFYMSQIDLYGIVPDIVEKKV